MSETSYLKGTRMPNDMCSEMQSFLEEKLMFSQAEGTETVLKSTCHINYGIGRQ